MQVKANGKQALWVLAIALVLIALCLGGLWTYIQSADAETDVMETSLAEFPAENEIRITWEKYDNYPVASDDGIYGWQNGKPLREAEIQRISELAKAYAQGLRPKNNAPSLPDESDFAIVPLDPNEFAGMTEYYFLPDMELTDQELLMLIAYGDTVGVPFTENTLTAKNCARWFNTYCNRYLSAGESARLSNLSNRVRTEGLRPESPEFPDLTLAKLPVSSVGGIRMYSAVPDAFYTFEFYPIREMTDEELLQTIYLDHEDGYTCLTPTQNKDLNPTEDKAKMRSLLEKMMGMPMSAKSTCLSYMQKDATGETRLNAEFKSALVNGKETEYTVIIQMSSGKILYIEQWTSYPYIPGAADVPPSPDIYDRRWADVAMKAVSRLTNEESTSASPTGAEANSDSMEAYISFDVSMKDGGSYAVHIRVSDGMFMSAQYLSDDFDPVSYNMW